MICLAVALGASAKFRVGPVVGASFDRFSWNQHLFGSSIRPGFAAGVQCEVMIPGIGFGVDFGLRYANRGGQCDFGDRFVWASDGIEDTNLRFHTIQVPLNLKFKWTRMDGFENYLAPFIFGGPKFNFNAANSKCEAIRRVKASVGLQVGLGVEIYKRFQLSGGYVWDVTYDTETYKLDNLSGNIEGWMIDFAVLF